APAFGSFLGIMWTVVFVKTTHTARINIINAIIYSAVLAMVALSTEYFVSLLCLAVVGLLEVFMTITRSSIMQIAAPEHMRGRVMANVGMVTRASGPLGETQSGSLTSLMGPTFAILFAATAIAVVAAGIGRFNRDLWHFSTKL